MTIATGAMLVVLFGIALAVMIVKAVDDNEDDGDDNTVNGFIISGVLIRYRSDNDFYVVDPITRKSMSVYADADLYLDSSGEFWTIAK